MRYASTALLGLLWWLNTCWSNRLQSGLTAYRGELYRGRERVQEIDTQQVPTVVKWTHDHQEKDAIERKMLGRGGDAFIPHWWETEAVGIAVFKARLLRLVSSSLQKQYSQVLSQNKRINWREVVGGGEAQQAAHLKQCFYPSETGSESVP